MKANSLIIRLLSIVTGWMFILVLCASCEYQNLTNLLTQQPKIQYYFNHPNTTQYNSSDSRMDDGLVHLIESAEKTLDMCFYGFYHPAVLDAVIDAHERGVLVRHVGSVTYAQSRHLGYVKLREYDIPSVVGNGASIMHDKFLVADNRAVFTGTANITTSGMEHNDNNACIIYDKEVAADFSREFEQMFEGRFGHSKFITDNQNKFWVGETLVEVYFSPQESPITQFYKAIQEATTNIRFMIFAFTKAEMGELMIQASKRGVDVKGVMDRSQLTHSMHVEVFRLISAMTDTSLEIRMDGNENTYVYGDWQGGGGRLHNKTMIVDYGTDHAKVLTGSFNWSNNANFNNDEVLLVIHSNEAAELFVENWNHHWNNGQGFVGDHAAPGEVIINEVFFSGSVDNAGNHYPKNQFIELKNTTNSPINMSFWVIDGITGYPNYPKWNQIGFVEGALIPANGYFIVTEPEINEANEVAANAFPQNDYYLNGFSSNMDFIQMQPYDMQIILKTSSGAVVDTAWNGTNVPSSVGGFTGGTSYSMERNEAAPGDGTDPANWHRCKTPNTSYDSSPSYLFSTNTYATPRGQNSPQ